MNQNVVAFSVSDLVNSLLLSYTIQVLLCLNDGVKEWQQDAGEEACPFMNEKRK